MAVWMPTAPDLGTRLTLRFEDAAHPGEDLFAEVRHVEPRPDSRGWRRVGLGLSTAPTGSPIKTRTPDRTAKAFSRAGQQWRLLSGTARLAAHRAIRALIPGEPQLPPVRIVDFRNPEGESIRGIIDSWGPTSGATAVVIPPAWGRTKETLMPLAACIVAGFRRARAPVVVLRYDGIRRRGESYNDPGCSEPGCDHHRFTFSQGVRDLRTAIDFLAAAPEFQPERLILVSFSAASIEARRAVARDPRIAGWISVVGASDLQSMMRVISGGVDYALGLERGLRFGLQEILGVEVDMDLAGLDAFSHDLVYLEDARRDLACIQVPVTWIHGQHDAWMDGDRARDVLSRGDTRKRRFIEVPTGHMLKTSRQALDTFQLVVGEIGRMALGREIPAAIPDLLDLERRQRAERVRLPSDVADVRSFWRDYLLGRDQTLGFELMTGITAYDDLMEQQIQALALRDGSRVADLGSGTGAFALHLANDPETPSVEVIAIDYVRGGLTRGRDRLGARAGSGPLTVRYLECDLSANGAAIPLATGSLDAVLASLLLSYLPRPESLLLEMRRVLRPGGRLVVSSLCRDADMSKLYTDGLAELRAGRARELFGERGEARLDDAARGYLNQASRLLDLEERGVFRFWDARELAQQVRRAGFRVVATASSLGDPPQAVVLVAERN
jgi:ubiquinone/menaquinone biosynthesis C-methylase UbiE/pimeloyl-ACP methyl ester carboxylesterase